MAVTKHIQNKKRETGKLGVFTSIILVLLLLFSLLILAIGVWALTASLTDPSEFRYEPVGFPSSLCWANYSTVFRALEIPVVRNGTKYFIGMPYMILYSVIYSVGAAFLNTFVQCITAYVTSKYPNKFSKLIVAVVLIVMTVPVVGATTSEVALAKTLGIYDTLYIVPMMKAGFGGAYFLVFFGLFSGLSDTYREAAQLDGAGSFTVCFKIYFPMAFSMFMTVFLLNFITYWNDYQTPLMFMPSYPTLAYGIYTISFSTTTTISNPPMKMACCMIMFVPLLVLFFVFSKPLMRGVAVGGIKG